MASLQASLIGREIDKFVVSVVTGTTAVAVANPDGSNIGGNATLNSSPNWIGLVSTTSINGIVTLAGGSLVSINGSVAVPNLVSMASMNGIITLAGGSLASINGLVGITGLISLASGTPVLVNNLVSVASINGKVDVGTITNLASLASIYGLVQVNNVASLASIYGQVQIVGGLLSLASGTYVGIGANSSLPSINGKVDTITVTTAGNKTLNISPIALNATNLSGATLFVNAVSSKKWYVTNIWLSMASAVGIAFLSNGTYLTGNASIRGQITANSGMIDNGSPQSPLYFGLTTNTNFLIATDTAAPISGRVEWYEE